MNIQVMSDLHIEFHRDGGDSMLASMDSTDVDVLILAGDIGMIRQGDDYPLIDFLKKVSDKYPHVVYVNGNHEFYGLDANVADNYLGQLNGNMPSNFHRLENESVTIDGQRFIGTAMWFGNPDGMNTYYKKNMADFNVIRGLQDWVYTRNQFSIDYLNQNVLADDVVITHHLPSYFFISPQWQGSQLNRFFANVIPEDLLLRPKVWVYGHTHDSGDQTLDKTRFICNPMGYAHEQNSNFKDKLIVTV